jgi:hypothetical protein
VLSRWAIEPSLKAQRVSKVQLGPQGLDLFWSCVCRAAEPKYSPTRQVAACLQAWFNQ